MCVCVCVCVCACASAAVLIIASATFYACKAMASRDHWYAICFLESDVQLERMEPEHVAAMYCYKCMTCLCPNAHACPVFSIDLHEDQEYQHNLHVVQQNTTHYSSCCFYTDERRKRHRQMMTHTLCICSFIYGCAR